MIFEYNGTEYDFPDNISDDEALRLIQQDQKQTTTSSPAMGQSQSSSAVTGEQKKPITDTNLFGLPDNVEKAVFPTGGVQATGERESTIGGSIKQGAMAGLDALSLPVRALGSLRTNPETGEKYKISDVESNLFRPEINKVKGLINKGAPIVTTDKEGSAPQFNPMGSFALTSGDDGKEVASAATELVGGMAGDPTVLFGGASRKAIGKTLSKLGTKSNSALGKLAQELSGVSEETLRKVGTGFGKGAQELKAAAGTQKQIGEKLLDALDNFDDYIPEKQVVDKAIEKIPDVNVNTIVNKLESHKIPLDIAVEDDLVTNKKIDSWITMISNKADENGNIDAVTLRNIRKRMDAKAKDAFGKDADDYVTALKTTRHTIAQDLVKSAESSGMPEYAEAMKSWSKKLELADDLKGYLGKAEKTREKRVEQFIGTMFGKNKSDRRRVIKELGEVFGEDFLKESKLASMAAELGDDGAAGLLPKQFNGRSALGAVLSGGGFAAGMGPASLVPLALSSPRLSSATLAGIDAIGTGLSYTGKGVNAGLSTTKIVEKVPGISAAAQNLMLKNKKKRYGALSGMEED